MQLDEVQVRVLGCLIEKQMTTPDYYPLSINALVTGCNQASNRDPVMTLDETTVVRGLTSLQDLELVRAVHRPGQRTVKYRHILDEALFIDPEQWSLLAVLMLRGDQTVGELRTRTTRYRNFPDLMAVENVLDGLATRDDPLVRRLERRPGEKESRYHQLLGGDGATDGSAVAAHPVAEVAASRVDGPGDAAADDVAARIGDLEERLGRLERTVESLVEALEPAADEGPG